MADKLNASFVIRKLNNLFLLPWNSAWKIYQPVNVRPVAIMKTKYILLEELQGLSKINYLLLVLYLIT
jgi:hypothetical protein